MYDIAVIGAGPAGSSFARLAPENLRIALIDKRNLDVNEGFNRIKCCGGLLAPAAQKELAEQGLGLPESILRGPQTFGVKAIDIDNGLVRFYQRHYINMDRECFDRWLVSLVPGNVETFFSKVFVSYERKDGFFVINITDDKERKEIRARSLVAADGAGSLIRRREFPDRMIREYIAIQDTYEHDGNYPYYFSIFDKDTTDFYSWIIQKGKYIHLGSAVPTGTDAVARHVTLVKKLEGMGIIKGKPVRRNGSLICRPMKISQITESSDGIYFIGEAAGFISPSSAEGISYALQSGRKLAEAFTQGDNVAERYQKLLRSMRFNLIYKRFKSRIMYSVLLRKIIMMSGILSIRKGDGND